EFIGESMLAEIILRVELASCLEHEHGHPAFGEYFSRPAARCARADDNGVIDFAARSLHRLVSSKNRQDLQDCSGFCELISILNNPVNPVYFHFSGRRQG